MPRRPSPALVQGERIGKSGGGVARKSSLTSTSISDTWRVQSNRKQAGSGGIYAEHLEAKGEGIHHVGFFVSNLDKKLAALRAIGIAPVQSGEIRSRGGAVTRYAYYETGGPGNIVAEFIETKILGVPVGMSSLMMNIGCLTGDAQRVRL